jgi:hypothetical protein
MPFRSGSMRMAGAADAVKPTGAVSPAETPEPIVAGKAAESAIRVKMTGPMRTIIMAATLKRMIDARGVVAHA